jgi:DivIVA domain-containing protein
MPKKRKQPEMTAPSPEPRRVTPVDIQQKEFRVAFRGYAMAEVDSFLDEVTEEVARLYADNKRLREDAEFGRTSRLEMGGATEADAIIRQAREEAARIVAEATARASATGDVTAPFQPSQAGTTHGPAGLSTEMMGIFLARERAFLQNMANLIQAHAEGVKQDVRRARERPVRPTPAEPPEPAVSAASRSEPAEASEASEPRQAGAPAPPEEEARPAEETSQEIVDLTRESEPIGEAAEEGVLSTVPEGMAPATNIAEGSSINPGPSPRPGVEEDDVPEDRSIRELFWGED